MAGSEIRPQPDDDVAAAVEIEDQGVEIVGHEKRLRKGAESLAA
jgi:hypothetical protein